jgi:tetratricopeptide (TPR) repeat protein
MLLTPPLRLRAARTAVLAAALAALAAVAPGQAETHQGSASEVERLITEGRKLLDLRKPAEAEDLFTQAAELDGNTLKTRMWVLRAWMDQGGRSNDTLSELDAIAQSQDGPDVDYLYGMAWARRAEENLAAKATQAIAMNFGDAAAFLASATAADPERYRDAFLPLARAAWYQTDLPTARGAAEEALRRYPQDPEAAYQLGRIALSQYSEAKDDEARAGEAQSAWEAARDGFKRAVELSGTPGARDWRAQSLLGEAYLQLGHTLMWKGLAEEARAAYVGALTWNPGGADLGALHGMLGAEDLGAILEKAGPAFEKRFGKADARDAALLWWLGYTRFLASKPKEAEQAFLAALKKAPGFANAWFYVAMARYDLKNVEGATEALLKGFDVDPNAIVGEARGNRNNVAKVEYLIGPCVEQGRFMDAAVLAEICAEGAVDEARHWNNLGFFRREEAVRLAALKDETERARAHPLFEDSLEAYERALALSPDDPVYLNDTAVVLHYYLDRDLERAAELYARAVAAAEQKLAAGGLDQEAMDLVQTALRDATNNGNALAKLLDERARGAEKRPAGASAGGSPVGER